jgi:hypothetical protein
LEKASFETDLELFILANETCSQIPVADTFVPFSLNSKTTTDMQMQMNQSFFSALGISSNRRASNADVPNASSSSLSLAANEYSSGKLSHHSSGLSLVSNSNSVGNGPKSPHTPSLMEVSNGVTRRQSTQSTHFVDPVPIESLNKPVPPPPQSVVTAASLEACLFSGNILKIRLT